MKISKLLAEYLLTRGCDQNGIRSEDYHSLDHDNVSVLACHQYTAGDIRFTIIVDTIGVLNVRYEPEDFADGIGFHKHVLELENV